MAGDIRKNISRSEMACEDNCGFDTCDTDLMDLLQDEVDHFQEIVGEDAIVILVITGPNRCRNRNELVQADAAVARGEVYIPFSSNSLHIYAKAADHKLFVKWNTGQKTQISPKDQYDYLDKKYPDRNGFGLYSNRVHADIRPFKARW